MLNDPSLAADRQQLLDYMQQNPAEFVDFNIPWQELPRLFIIFLNPVKD